MVIRFLLFFAFVVLKCVHNEYLPPLKGMEGLWITCDNEEKLDFVLQYKELPGFDFMKVTRLPENNVHVLVSSDRVSFFKRTLDLQGIEYQVIIDDFEKLINEEAASQKISRKRSHDIYDFSYFPRYNDIKTYLRHLAEINDDITLMSVGLSYEGREMYGVQISNYDNNNREKPAIFIDAGIHAREWIAPSTALYIISQLANATNKHLYENVDWYIFPQINPDGYEYSHTSHRLWRKTRSRTTSATCVGVDGNRNFDYKWMEVGASSNPCSDTYAGTRPFSENETLNIRNFILSKNGTVKVYLTFHSYGQYMLHPWGYTSALPENEPTLRTVAEKAEKALSAIRGTRYQIGSSTNVLYPAAGGSDDWAMAVGGAGLSYTVELPGKSFVTPSSQIIPVGLETFEAIKIFGEYVSKTYP